MVFPGCPSDVADKLLGRHRGGVGFLSHLRSLRATMSQKSSLPQAASFVSQVLKRDTQCPQRRFSEQLTVCDRGAAKLPEAMVGEDACDARLTGIGTQKGLMHEMHSAQGEITDRPHAEMLFASGGSLA